MRVLRLGFWWLLFPPLVLALFVAFVLFTTAGARLAATLAEALVTPLSIDNVDGSIAYGLRAGRVTWAQPEVTVTLNGLASVWEPRCLWQGRICVESLVAGRLHIHVPASDATAVPGQAKKDFLPLNLPLLVLPWRLRVEQFHLAELLIDAGGRLTTINPVTFRAEWAGSRVAIESLYTSTTDADIGALDARLSGAIDMRSEWPFDLVLQTDYIPPLQKWNQQQIMLTGSGNVRNLFLRGDITANINVPEMEPLQLRATAVTHSLNTEVQLQALNGHWQNAPLFAKGGVTFSRQGVLELQQLLLRWGENSATLNGTLQQQWDVDAALALTQPQLLAPDAVGRFDGTARITGKRGDPLVDVQLVSDVLQLPNLELQQLKVQGSVAPVSFSSLNVQAQVAEIRVASQQLQDVAVTLQGDADAHALTVQARRGGRQLSTAAHGKLDINEFDWQGQIERIQLQMQPDWAITLEKPVDVRWRHASQRISWSHHCLLDQTGRICSQAELDLPRQQIVAQVQITQFDLAHLQEFLGDELGLQGIVNADLRVKEQILHPDIQGELQFSEIQVQQSLRNEVVVENGSIDAQFRGKQALLTTAVDLPPGLHWRSAAPVTLDWRKNGVTMPESCWNAVRLKTEALPTADLGSLCLQVTAAQSGGLNAVADLDLAIAPALQPWLPGTLGTQGQLQAHAQASIKGRAVDARLSASLQQGALSLQQNTEQPPLRFTLDQLQLNARLQNEVLHADLDMQSTELGAGKATARIQVRQQDPQMTLQANLRGLNVAILQPLLPHLSELQGNVAVDLLAEGPVGAPDIKGGVDINNVRVQSAAVPAGIDDLDARLVFTGDRGDLTGTLKSGKGRAELLGEMVRAPTGWQASLNLDGRSVPLRQPPDVRFLLHPDLSVVADANSLRLEGTVLVNEGFLVIKPLPPDAIGVSADVEFVDERGNRLQKTTGMEIGMDVVASVEPSLRIRGFGAEVRLKGSVRVTLDKSGVMIGRGTIDIEEGSYTGYGQQLTIRKGQLIFNGPLNQPYVNLEAVRQVDNVVAGIRVSGPASEPVATLFSEPTLSDSQILYYIVTGKAPGTGTEDDNTAARNALLTVGLMGGQPLARDVASKIGIDDLQMGTAGSGDETAVTVSGYLNSRTYLQYGVSVFEPVNTLTVRYRLRDNLFLEAISGIASALDVLYSFEF